jgi:hypothetical protein
MAKEESVQKKKTLGNTISRIVFKILVAVAVLIFTYVIVDKSDISLGTFNSKDGKDSKVIRTPHELKWFNDFKGVENVPSKQQKEKSSEKKGIF